MLNTYIEVKNLEKRGRGSFFQTLSHWTAQANRSQSTFSSTGPASRSDGTKKQRSLRLYIEAYDSSSWSDDHFDEDFLLPSVMQLDEKQHP